MSTSATGSEHINLYSQTSTSPSSYSTPPYGAQKKFNPHELNEAEIKEIPEKEKEAVMAQPGELGSMWSEVMGAKGKYSTTVTGFFKREAPSVLAMLESVNKTEDISHLAFGEFCFKLDKEKIIRTTYYKKGAGTTGGFNSSYNNNKSQYFAKKNRKIADVFVADPDMMREFLQKEENKGKWEMMSNPLISPVDGKVIVFMAKYID